MFPRIIAFGRTAEPTAADRFPQDPCAVAPDDALGAATERPVMCADTFGVGIRLTEAELEFVVHVPSDIDSGWTDPEAFQSLVADVVWTELDQQAVLETVAHSRETGDTVTLGTVSIESDGTVVDHDLQPPEP